MAEVPQVWRVVLQGAFQDGWLLADQPEKDTVFRYWVQVHKQWTNWGARFIASVDSELLNLGAAPVGSWNFCELWEIPDPALVKQMLDCFRYPKDGGPRIDKYFRFQAVIGRPIGSLERELAS